MKYKEPISTPVAAKDFLLSDKPPDRRLLRKFPIYIRWGYYFAIFSVFLSALWVSPNLKQIFVFLFFAGLLAVYMGIRFVLVKRKHWLFTENAVWLHGLAGILGSAGLYFLFRISGYGMEENDPANIWIISLIPLGIVSRYGKTRHWGMLLSLNVVLLLCIRVGFGVFLLGEPFLDAIDLFDNWKIPYVSPTYVSIVNQVVLILMASTGIHYAVRWRRMSQLRTNIQLEVFSELAGNLDLEKSYTKTAERIHRLKNMPIDYYPYVYIMRWDEDADSLKVIGGAGKPEELWRDVEVHSGKGITGRAFTTQKIVNMGNVKSLPEEQYCCPQGHEDVHSELAIPITFQNCRLGVLDVQSPNEYEFGEDDRRLLKILADGIGIAMANSIQLDARVSNALQVSNKLLEASEKNRRLSQWFKEVSKVGTECLGADHIILFRLSPGTRYPLQPVFLWPKVTDRFYDGQWPITDSSALWSLLRKWEPIYGLELADKKVSGEQVPDTWAYRFLKAENISTVAFLPIGERDPQAALFVCYKSPRSFSDIDKLSLSVFASSIERSYKKMELESAKTAGKTIHSVLVPQTLLVLGELENIENNIENKKAALAYIESARNLIVDLRKRVVLATVGVGDYDYVPGKHSLRSVLVKLGAALNASQNRRVVFDIKGTENIEGQDPLFLEILHELIGEAMGNAVVHGNASRVEIGVDKNDRQINFCVLDNGIGLQPGHDRARPHGIYFWKRYLRYRFNVLLKIANRPEGGVRISASFPIPPQS